MSAEMVHQRLKKFREGAKLTAKEMARQIGVAQSTYLDWENGKGMRLPPFQKISQVLAISVTELLTGEKPELTVLLDHLGELEKKVVEIKGNIASLL